MRETFRKIYSRDQQLIKTTRRTFDPDTGTATASIQVGAAESRERHWDHVKDVATPTSLLFVVRDALRNGRKTGSIKLITSEPSMYTLRWVPRGTEQVTVPAGTFTCVKVELLVDVGLLRILRPLLPKLLVWYTADEPFHWIKYEGLEDGIRSPKIVIERTSRVEDR